MVYLCGRGRRSGGSKTDCDNATEIGRPRPNCCLSQVIRVASPTVTDIVISLTASHYSMAYSGKLFCLCVTWVKQVAIL